MRTILVTGGAGFIGANLVHYLMEKYPLDKIVVLDALTYAGAVENLPPDMVRSHDSRALLWYGNVCNAALVDTLVEEADVVIHLAAETHVTRSIHDSLQFFQTDVLGLKRLRTRLPGSDAISNALSMSRHRRCMETPSRTAWMKTIH